MSQRPECAVEGCERKAFMMFAGQWVCGECVVAYDKKVKEKTFNQLQEALSNGDNNLS